MHAPVSATIQMLVDSMQELPDPDSVVRVLVRDGGLVDDEQDACSEVYAKLDGGAVVGWLIYTLSVCDGLLLPGSIEIFTDPAHRRTGVMTSIFKEFWLARRFRVASQNLSDDAKRFIAGSLQNSATDELIAGSAGGVYSCSDFGFHYDRFDCDCPDRRGGLP
jgi:hypothetical protein